MTSAYLSELWQIAACCVIGGLALGFLAALIRAE